MNHIDYSSVKGLFVMYRQIFARSLSVEENDLVAEMAAKLNDLDELSKEIVDLLSELDALRHPDLIPDGEGNDILNIMGHSLRLKRADPSVPIKRAQSVVGYERASADSARSPEIGNLERRLERATTLYYQSAHRVTHIAEKLPRLTTFKCAAVRVVRNQLLEHPEGKGSGVTYDTFGYSKQDGPFVKGLRRAQQMGHRDEGFRKNSGTFVSNLTKALGQALALDREARPVG